LTAGEHRYSGGYGADYAINLAVFANLSAGTGYQIPPSAMQVLSLYLLDGQQYMVHAAADRNGNGTYYDVPTNTLPLLQRISSASAGDVTYYIYV
jgi:hypothetical protein